MIRPPLETILGAALAASGLAGCAVQGQGTGMMAAAPQPQTRTVNYRRSERPVVVRTPRGVVRMALMVGDDGSFPVDSVPGVRGPFTVGVVDARGFWYASADGRSAPPFEYQISDAGGWVNMALTPDGRGLLFFSGRFSATRRGGGGGDVYVNVANARLPQSALSSLTEGDEVTLSFDDSAAAPAAAPAPAAGGGEWWRTPATR